MCILPVESSGEHEIVVCADFIEAAVMECLVIYQTAGLVDDDEREDSPS